MKLRRRQSQRAGNRALPAGGLPPLTNFLQRARIGHPRAELLAGLVTALALIPETISFSIVAGVDPRVGLLSSFTFSVVIALMGGRPGMVSAAAGSMALVAAPLVHAHGLQYLIAATVLAGAIQMLLSAVGIARLLAMLPRAVTIGFVNGLAILIFAAQMPRIVSPTVFWLVLVGAAIIFAARARNVRVPPSLISTIVLTLAAVALSLHAPTVGSEGALPSGLPSFAAPHLPMTLHLLAVIWPYSLSLAAVGLVESLLTAEILDRVTASSSSKRREAFGQGVANVLTGFFGGQPGCAMIGQSLLCVDTGGRGRLSTLAAGAWLLILVVILAPLMRIMPMAALVATMVVVALTTFDWRSIAPGRLRAWPITESLVMALTTVVIILTSNLAIGVGVGAIAASAIFLGRRLVTSVRLEVHTTSDADSLRHHVHGALFFASAGQLIDKLALDAGDGRPVHIDLSRSRLWNASSIRALEDALRHHRSHGMEVTISGLDEIKGKLRRRVRKADSKRESD